MKSISKLVLSMVMVSALAACGGSDGPLPPTVITPAVVTAPASAGTIAAIVDKTFTFGDVLAMGTTSPTALKFTGGGASPSFAITSPEGSATGATTFGSCIFTIASGSTYPATHPLASGKTVRIDPCALTLATSGTPANGSSNPTQAAFTLGTLVSAGIPLPVSVSADGTVSVGGVVLPVKAVVSTITGT
jgi:predicted small lipoprotein YifL